MADVLEDLHLAVNQLQNLLSLNLQRGFINVQKYTKTGLAKVDKGWRLLNPSDKKFIETDGC